MLIDWYLPGRKAGGPVKSVESMVWALKDQFNFYILTTDTDLGASNPYKEIQPEQWLDGEDGCKVYYLKKERLSLQKLQHAINTVQYDYLYLNSFYSKWFSIIPLKLKKKGKIKGPAILAPRGMLSPGALALKPVKKKAFILYSRLTKLHEDITWHATYEREEEEIRKFYGAKAQVAMCPNFSRPVQPEHPAPVKTKGSLKLFYLSRVSRVKNLHIALQSLAAMNIPARIEYDIYGSHEDAAYLEECRKIAATLSPAISVRFMGEVANEDLGKIICNYHFLFLPTSNENFGHSIFETLQCGCPVIISDRTPWRNLQQQHCGWDVPPDPQSLLPVLKACVEMEEEQYRPMADAAKTVAAKKQDLGALIKAAEKLFN